MAHTNRTTTFNANGANWVADPDVVEKLTRLGVPCPSPPAVCWRLTTAENDVVENYDGLGQLLSLVNRSGLTITVARDTQGRVSTVTDHFQRSIVFNYDNRNVLQSIKDPDNMVYQFGYDANRNLTSVTYPDSTSRHYHYESPAQSYLLTGISVNGVRFSTYGYDAINRADLTEHAGGVNRYTLVFNGNGTTSVTDPLNESRTYSFALNFAVRQLTAITGSACPTCGPGSQGYDANGFVNARTDWNGNKTCFAHDTRGLETARVEGLGAGVDCSSLPTPIGVQRKISTEWHPVYRLVKKLAEPKRLTTYVFNGEGANCGPSGAPTPAGLVCTKTEQATTDLNGSAGLTPAVTGNPRTWTYAYNAEGQVRTITGPRTDVTTYTYHANNATCAGVSPIGCQGQVHTITNALGHLTTIDEYNAHGQPIKITDPNLLVTILEYDLRQRLTKRTVGGGSGTPEVTSYEYWPTGLLKKVTRPDASFVLFDYDDAHRLRQIEDGVGNQIVYTLDAMGNRTTEAVKDAGGTIRRNITRVYNELNRLRSITGGLQ